ncbi:MAG: hypothetical protein ABMA14_26780, partial [Hyphomonadaceae bacterium]
LMHVVARLPQGAVYLPGLDRTPDAEDWLAIEEDASHPQYGLVQLLKRFELTRDQVGTCLDSEEIDKLTREGVKAAPGSVTGTPSFIIKGEKLEAESFEGLAAAIDAELAKAAQPAAPT